MLSCVEKWIYFTKCLLYLFAFAVCRLLKYLPISDWLFLQFVIELKVSSFAWRSEAVLYFLKAKETLLQSVIVYLTECPGEASWLLDDQKTCLISNVRTMYDSGSQAFQVEDHVYNCQYLSRLQHFLHSKVQTMPWFWARKNWFDTNPNVYKSCVISFS